MCTNLSPHLTFFQGMASSSGGFSPNAENWIPHDSSKVPSFPPDFRRPPPGLMPPPPAPVETGREQFTPEKTPSDAIPIPKPIPSRLATEQPEASFSPSKLSTSALNTFNDEESSGVPLQTAWTFWLDRPVHNASMAEYKASLKKIYTVSTVQGFWSVYHHIPEVWELKLRTYYHLMREEKEPLWEDPSLAKGGVWRLKCPKRETVISSSMDFFFYDFFFIFCGKQRNSKKKLKRIIYFSLFYGKLQVILNLFQSRVWKELLLAAIGEQFSDHVHDGDDVCGLSVSPREKDDLIQIWNVKSENVENSNVLDKVHKLLPDVRFNAEFYKRKFFLSPKCDDFHNPFSAHQTHSAFEGARQ